MRMIFASFSALPAVLRAELCPLFLFLHCLRSPLACQIAWIGLASWLLVCSCVGSLARVLGDVLGRWAVCVRYRFLVGLLARLFGSWLACSIGRWVARTATCLLGGLLACLVH